MKYLLALLLITSGINLQAQSRFHWASAVQDLRLEYLSLKAHPDGGVVALALRDHLPSTGSSRPAFFDSGKHAYSNEAIQTSSATWIFRLDKNGQLLWLKAVPQTYAAISALAICSDSTVLLFADVKEADEDEDGTTYGLLEGLTDEEMPTGKMIIRLSKTGDLLETVPLKQLQTTAGEDFLIYGLQPYQDGFLLNGYTEDGHLVKNDVTESGGGDVIMCFSADGSIRWHHKVIFGRNDNTEAGNTVDAAPDGTIYMGGTYFRSARFSNGKSVNVPIKTKEENKMTEVYVIAYDSKGKIQWIRTEQSNSVFHRLKATNAGVFIGHEIHGKLAFGEKVKPLTDADMALTFLSKKGKTAWNVITGTGDYYGMEITENGNLAVLGSFVHWDGQPAHSRKFGAFSMNAEDDVFVLTLDKNGKAAALWSAHLHIHIQQRMYFTTCRQNSYVALEVQCGPKRGLSVLDSSFPDVKCHSATVPVLGKIK